MLSPVQLPPPVIVEHDGITVVRDDLLPGGTKRRALHTLLDDEHDEFVYASPVYGHAQIALAYTARDYGKTATIFCAKRKMWHPLTQHAHDQGAQIHEVPNGYLSVVTARAREYCAERPTRKLLPFGLDDPLFIEELAAVARQLPALPEVWSITSSGVLTRALQLAWPSSRFYGVRVGAEPNAGLCAGVFLAPEEFSQNAKHPPPFPSCLNYDAKAWDFVLARAERGHTLFWNVAG